MAAAKNASTSIQRVLISMDESMKKEAAEMFAAHGTSFSEGVRQCIAARLAGNEDSAILLDGKTKKEAETVLAEMGLDVKTAVNIFLKEVIRTGCIPFAVQSGKAPSTYALVSLEQESETAAQDQSANISIY